MLHVYLGGTAVEVMANSDNVLRGGLTPKHVDVESLLAVVTTEPLVPEVQRPVPADGVARYHAAAPEFSVRRVDVDGPVSLPGGPAVVLCVDGVVTTPTRTVERGTAAWVTAAEPELALDGRGRVFHVAVGAD